VYLSRQQIAQFDRDGYCLVEHAFSADTLAELIAAIDPWEESETDFLRTQPHGAMFIAQADAITFTVHLVGRSETCRGFSTHPSLLGIVRDLIGPSVRMYWDQAVYKKPEPDREFPWHQDNGYAFVEPQQYLTCWIPLTDATLANGCPWVAPRRHRLGTLQHWAGSFGLTCLDAVDDAVPVEAPAGSAVVFSSLTPHRTGPNTTDTVRKAYIVQYAPDGASVRRDDGDVLADAADRQYEVLRDGRPV
jgi:ectoine hydroxylase-related dioxygenase (phytanoyl-CoA dioxygenase family)